MVHRPSERPTAHGIRVAVSFRSRTQGSLADDALGCAADQRSALNKPFETRLGREYQLDFPGRRAVGGLVVAGAETDADDVAAGGGAGLDVDAVAAHSAVNGRADLVAEFFEAGQRRPDEIAVADPRAAEFQGSRSRRIVAGVGICSA
jgi:hypothetical protein